jgi:hypothetical protein
VIELEEKGKGGGRGEEKHKGNNQTIILSNTFKTIGTCLSSCKIKTMKNPHQQELTVCL